MELAVQIATLVTAVSAALLIWVTWRISEGLRHRDRRTAFTALHLLMTTGDVAAARHRVFGLLEEEPDARAAKLSAQYDEYVQDLFALIWVLESVGNTRATHRRSVVVPGAHSDFLGWNEGEIARNVHSLARMLSSVTGRRLSVGDSWQRFAAAYPSDQYASPVAA